MGLRRSKFNSAQWCLLGAGTLAALFISSTGRFGVRELGSAPKGVRPEAPTRMVRLVSSPGTGDNLSQPSKVRLIENYGKLPLSFEANGCQGDPKVMFLSRGRGYTLTTHVGPTAPATATATTLL